MMLTHLFPAPPPLLWLCCLGLGGRRLRDLWLRGLWLRGLWLRGLLDGTIRLVSPTAASSPSLPHRPRRGYCNTANRFVNNKQQQQAVGFAPSRLSLKSSHSSMSNVGDRGTTRVYDEGVELGLLPPDHPQPAAPPAATPALVPPAAPARRAAPSAAQRSAPASAASSAAVGAGLYTAATAANAADRAGVLDLTLAGSHPLSISLYLLSSHLLLLVSRCVLTTSFSLCACHEQVSVLQRQIYDHLLGAYHLLCVIVYNLCTTHSHLSAAAGRRCAHTH